MNIIKTENGIMSKESFCQVMDNYRSMFDFTDEMNDLFRKYKSDGEVFPPMCTRTVVDLLEYIFNDVNEWIQYWTLELEFGERYEDGDVQDKDGNNISLKTSENLYDLLVRNMKESKEE